MDSASRKYNSPRTGREFASLNTLLDVAVSHANNLANEQFLLWLDNGKHESCRFTFAELDERARALAVRLTATIATSHVVARQDAVLIATKPGPEFVVAFFACIYAGVAAVPVPPLRKGAAASSMVNILQDCDAKAILVDRDSLSRLKREEQLSSQPLIGIEDTDSSLAAQWRHPGVTSDTTAFIQYTSGSTGFPKGVLINHRNLISNEVMMAESMNHSSESVFVSWLPVYHDMGLIGNLLMAFCLGVRCVLMSPQAFIANPYDWLKAISTYKATMSGGPNFAYDLCVSRISEPQRQNLDLSSWKVAFNGAEPIRSDTLGRFVEVFAHCGLDRHAIYPCYGMAESTLFVTGKRFSESYCTLKVDKEQLTLDRAQIVTDPTTHAGVVVELVSSGYSANNCKVMILDPHEHTLVGDRRVGEVWVSAPSVSRAYKNKPELSKTQLNAQIVGLSDGNRYLRTGDLGFIHEEQLYITGRCKELIIVAGKNHYPQDIEATSKFALAREYNIDPMLFTCAAFSQDVNGTEQVSMVLYAHHRVAERISLDFAAKLIRTAVSRQHGLGLHEVRFVNCRLPVTSSGKLKRIKCRDMLVTGAFDEYSLRKSAGQESCPQVVKEMEAPVE